MRPDLAEAIEQVGAVSGHLLARLLAPVELRAGETQQLQGVGTRGDSRRVSAEGNPERPTQKALLSRAVSDRETRTRTGDTTIFRRRFKAIERH